MNANADAELLEADITQSVEMSEYAIALQHAIEAYCRGEQITGDTFARCPHHAKKLNSCALAAAINAELLEALKLATRQNSFDMLMTGEELRKCEAAIARATQEAQK